MKLLTAFLLFLCASWSNRESEIRESAITFRIQNAGITVNGTFDGLEADVQFDPDRLGNADIRASVPVSSIRTGIALRDKHLQRPDYFHSEKFPRITLASKTVRKTGRGRYEGLFDLNIKGIAHEVKIPFTYSADNTFNGSFRLNRLDFELGQSSLVLADEVEVQILVKMAVPAGPLSKN